MQCKKVIQLLLLTEPYNENIDLMKETISDDEQISTAGRLMSVSQPVMYMMLRDGRSTGRHQLQLSAAAAAAAATERSHNYIAKTYVVPVTI